MRQTYVVCYDICDQKRLRKVFKIMRGYGDHVQFSVFRCELTDKERVELTAKLTDAIHSGDDQVLFVDLGPADGRARSVVSSIGRAYTHSEWHAVVI